MFCLLLRFIIVITFISLSLFDCSTDKIEKRPDILKPSLSKKQMSQVPPDKVYFPVHYAGYSFVLRNQNNTIQKTFEIMKYNPKKRSITYVEKSRYGSKKRFKTYYNCKIKNNFLVLYSKQKVDNLGKVLKKDNFPKGMKLLKIMNIREGDKWEINTADYKAKFTVESRNAIVKTKTGDYTCFKIKEEDTIYKGKNRGKTSVGYLYITKYYGIIQIEVGDQLFKLVKIKKPPLQ